MKRWLNRGVLVALGSILGVAIEGIIANRADSAFLFMISWISKSVGENILPWLVTGGMAVICLGEGFYSWQHSRILNQALTRANKMNELDGSLLRVLASWTPSADREERKKRILKEVLRDSTTEFNGHVFRAAVLLPDTTGEFLKCWAHYQMPLDSIENMEFYIGNDARKRQEKGGVAGEVFSSGKLRIGHLTRINDQWICADCESYVKFGGHKPFPTYKSFVNVPIIGIDPTTMNATTCLGVVCFDSQNAMVFDHEEIKIILLTLASRIAAALLICQKLP